MDREPAVYMMASGFNATIYTGVTSNLLQRLHQHRTGTFGGFTTEYSVKRLVWFEMHSTMESAIAREKQLKNWRREWKVALIVGANPTWRDLAEDSGSSRSSGDGPIEQVRSAPRSAVMPGA